MPSCPTTRSLTEVTQDSRPPRCGSLGSFQRSERRLCAAVKSSAALLLTFLSVVRRAMKRWLRCCTRSSWGVMDVSCSLESCWVRRVWPSCSTWQVFDCITLPLRSRSNSRRSDISCTMRCTSPSLLATRASAPSASSTSPSRPSPPTTLRRLPRLCWMSARLELSSASSLLPASGAASLTSEAAAVAPSLAAAAGSSRRTQQSPSLHSRPPSGRSLPRKASSCSIVETVSEPQISSSVSSPQFHRIVASLMMQRSSPSSLPTHWPSKPSALRTMQFSRAMPALKASLIWGSARTSSAFSFRLSTTVFTSLASHSSQSLDAASTAPPAEAARRSCSFSRPRPCSASRSRANVPEWSLMSSAALVKKRSTSGSVIAAGHWTLPGRRKARPHGRSTTSRPSSAPPPPLAPQPPGPGRPAGPPAGPR
mmetsp:Transcript_113071/g.365198  ORF Transcript_113071/g.365198 Transcript_113071/m.365198 type:complete len:424 (-) Transcript_113071:330-1601(-)